MSETITITFSEEELQALHTMLREASPCSFSPGANVFPGEISKAVKREKIRAFLLKCHAQSALEAYVSRWQGQRLSAI
jgi:hypothetical protein